MCAAMDDPLVYIPEETEQELPSQNDLVKRLGANCFRKSKDTGKSAKDVIREKLGVYNSDNELPDYTIEELSILTKKSEINVRTMLSDLRSAKYCGRQGVFLTERIKRPDGKISFRFVPPAAYAEALRLHKDVPGLSGTPEEPTHDGRGGPYDIHTKKGVPVGRVEKNELPLLPVSLVAELEVISKSTTKQLKEKERIAQEYAKKFPEQAEAIKVREERKKAKKGELDESILQDL